MMQIRYAMWCAAGLAILLTSCGKTRRSGDQLAADGMRLFAAEKYQEAAVAFEGALQEGLSELKSEEVYTCLGNTYSELEDWEKAIHSHRKAIDTNPGYAKAWVNLGIVYRLTDDFAEAEGCYQKALELDPDYAELRSSMGTLCIFQGKYAEAVEHLEKAVELDSQLATAWANLSFAYATVGQFDKAEPALKKAVVLGYKHSATLRRRIDDLKGTSPR